jgi:hypothetical protein
MAIGPGPNTTVADVTVSHRQDRAPKFELVNQMLAAVNLDEFDVVLVCDDDISLPSGFVDRYLALVHHYDFALAQPARTHDSFTDHPSSSNSLV